jgi:hypothetical protein
MKRKVSMAPLWACIIAIACVVAGACHTTKPAQKSDQQKPAKQDTTKKIDTGPSEFFDGYIRYRTPGSTACVLPARGISAGQGISLLPDYAAKVL